MTHEQTENLLTVISAEKDGGRAFPFESRAGGVEFTNYGMTMRDYFAAQALVGVVQQWPHWTDEMRAKHVYAQADAMLAARETK